MNVHALLGCLLVQTLAPNGTEQPGGSLTTLGFELRGKSHGVDALGFDPGAIPRVDGWELQLRSRIADPVNGGARTALGLVVPLGPLAVGLGHEWLDIPGLEHQRFSFSLGARLSRRLSVGMAYRALFSSRSAIDGRGVWDFGVLAEPWPALAFSLGVDGVGQPTVAGVHSRAAYRVGAAVRPILGKPYLTLGGETRLFTGPQWYDVSESRVLIDVAPIEGLHLLGSYIFESRQVWVGAQVGLGGVSALLAATPTNGARSSLPWGASSGAVTLRSNPSESLVRFGKSVDVEMRGDLRRESGMLFVTTESVPTVALELERMARSPVVREVTLVLGELQIGLATVEELRRAVFHLRAAGKHVAAEVSSADERAYLVAAAANRVLMDPMGTLNLDGFAVTLFYLADTLAKVGVEAQLVEIGRYKSGGDALAKTGPRPEDREVNTELLDGAYRTLAGALVHDRHFDPNRIDEILGLKVVTAAEALELGLVDELTQPIDPREPVRLTARGDTLESLRQPRQTWGQPPIIRVIPVVGTMVMEEGQSVLPGPEAVASRVVGLLEAARTNSDVAAVVVRVDSPGGDVMAAELIWRAMRALGETKPIVVSMGDVAASGGYYVAAAADVVLAETQTITGSIGIFSLRINAQGLLDMLDVHTTTYAQPRGADTGNLARPLDEAELERLRETLLSHYNAFVARVAAGRRMTLTRAEALAGGRVYLGERALELGLIDAVGGLHDAIAEAALRAGIDDVGNVSVSIPDAPLNLLSAAAALLVSASAPPPNLADLANAWWTRASAMARRPLALMPYGIELR